MPTYVFQDSKGVERVLRADSLSQAQDAVRRVEYQRSESLAAAEVAVRTLKVYA